MRDRVVDRHAMQSEVGYLFCGLWSREGEKGREGGREGETETQTETVEGEKWREGRDRSCLSQRETQAGI